MTDFLVSFCNQKWIKDREIVGRRTGDVLLARVDRRSRRVHGIRLEHELAPLWLGIAGLARCGDRIFAVTQGVACLVELSRSLTVRHVWPLSTVGDAHSIAVIDDSILIVSSANDSVVAFSPETRRERILWQAGPGPGRADTHHLNSILVVDDGLLISAFGLRRDGEGWSTARDGYVVDIQESRQQEPRQVMSPISHPHSLCRMDTGFAVCESLTGAVRGGDGSSLSIGGYARGLCFTAAHMLVGVSTFRTRSRSIGTDGANVTACGGLAGHRAAIAVFERSGALSASRRIDTIDLSFLADEIYDILPLPWE